MNDSLTQRVNRRDEFNVILKGWTQYFRANEIKLARLAYEKGATQVEIARCLGVSPSAVNQNYPKEVNRG